MPRPLLFSFSLLLFYSSTLLLSTAAHAAVGTHTSYGHNLPYFFCQATSGLPVTILISLTDDKPSMIDKRDCYKGASHLIIRVMGLTPYIKDDVLLPAALNLRDVFDPIASKTYIVFGNEVNVIDSVEYQCVSSLADCARSYATQFLHFYDFIGGHFPVGAAPLNLSHPTYDAAAFLSAAASAYNQANFYASNSYQEGGCPGGYDPIRCTKDSWQWYGQQLGDKANPPILTEFNISPGLNPTLTQVLDFLATQAPSGLAVTPLVKNTCSNIRDPNGNQWDWLIYIRGQLYDPDGNYVDPNSCTTSTPPTSALYRDPRQNGFPDPLMFSPANLNAPCDAVVPDILHPLTFEFHPLRPYPGSPCDPRIPRSNPEALVTLDKYYMSFACGKSIDVSSTYDFPLYQDIGGLPPFPTDSATAVPNTLYRCSPNSAPECYCPAPDPLSPTPIPKVCAIERSSYSVSIDLKNAQLPIVGNTQDPLDNATKVNQYLDWYLGGTVQQAEQILLDPFESSDIDRLVNFSGPLKKLLPFSTQQDIRRYLVTSPKLEQQYHDYMVGCIRGPLNPRYYDEVLKAWTQLKLQLVQAGIDTSQMTLDTSFDQLLLVVTTSPADVLNLITQAYITGNVGEVEWLLSAYTNLVHDSVAIYNANPNLFVAMGNFINKLLINHADTCNKDWTEWIDTMRRLSDVNETNFLFWSQSHLPPDPANYNNDFDAYWKDYLTWTGRVQIDIAGVKLGVLDVPWLSNAWSEIFAQIPFSSLEDTTGEVTFSLIPGQQPGLNSPFDPSLVSYLEGGFVYPTPVISGTPAPANAITLTVARQPDTRLYFPHIKNTNFLSYILQKLGRPRTDDFPGGVMNTNKTELTLPEQEVTEHQGLATDGTLTKSDLLTGKVDPKAYFDNSSVLPAPPLFTNYDQRCQPTDARVGPGDTLYGQTPAANAAASISFTTFLTYQARPYTPSKIAPAPDPNDAICGNLDRYILVTPTLTPPGNYFCARDILTGNCYLPNYPPIEGDNCGDLYWEPGPCDNLNCPTTRTRCLQVVTPAPEQVADCNGPYVDSSLSPNGPWPTPGGACQEFASCVCTLDVDGTFGMEDAYTCQGTNPDKTLPSEARVAVFTKTPFADRLYETLVGGADSVLRRFISAPNVPEGCDATCYAQIIDNWLPHGPDTIPAGTNVTYNSGLTNSTGSPNVNPPSSQGTLYFARLGSLYDFLLGGASDSDLNLQKLLRPQGFLSATFAPPTAGGGSLTCNMPLTSCGPVNWSNSLFGAYATAYNSDNNLSWSLVNESWARADIDSSGICPQFLATLWLEESGGSAVGSYDMGCIYFIDGTRAMGSDHQGGPTGPVFTNYTDFRNHYEPILQNQIACVKSYVAAIGDDFRTFMCQYSGEADIDPTRPYRQCQIFTNNPNFPTNMCQIGLSIGIASPNPAP